MYMFASHSIWAIIAKFPNRSIAASNKEKEEQEIKSKILSEGRLDFFESSPFCFRDPNDNKCHGESA